MNPSQLIAWLVCLALAFFACAVSFRNGYRIALLDKEFAEVKRVAGDQEELLEDIRGLLQRIERNVRPAARAEPAAAADVGSPD